MLTPVSSPAVRRGGAAAVVLALALGLSACSSAGHVTSRMATLGGLITPYQIDIVQGNVITSEQVQELSPGMPRLAVRDLLGTPLLQSVFHADRWDYVFTFKRQGQPEQVRRLSVFFSGDALERFEADDMPSEAEFVASLNVRRKPGKPPVLEATPEQLQAFRERNSRAGTTPAADPAPTPRPAASYPPLESSR